MVSILDREANLGIISAVLAGTYQPDPFKHTREVYFLVPKQDGSQDFDAVRSSRGRTIELVGSDDPLTGPLPGAIYSLFRGSDIPELLTEHPQTACEVAQNLIALGALVAEIGAWDYDDLRFDNPPEMSEEQATALRNKRCEEFQEFASTTRHSLDEIIISTRSSTAQFRDEVMAAIRSMVPPPYRVQHTINRDPTRRVSTQHG